MIYAWQDRDHSMISVTTTNNDCLDEKSYETNESLDDPTENFLRHFSASLVD